MEAEPTLIITPRLQQQILYLHSEVGKAEWSGVLLYKVIEGDINDPENMVIEAKGLFLLDIGSSAYTEYGVDERFMDVVDQYPEFIDDEWQMGHIHTHHNMTTFFSGTDQQELHDNVELYNYYLSLIVNFEGDYTAKIVTLARDSDSVVWMKNREGEYVQYLEKGGERMIQFDCDIHLVTEDFLQKQLEETVAKKKAEAAARAAAAKANQVKSTQHGTTGKAGKSPQSGKQYSLPLTTVPSDEDVYVFPLMEVSRFMSKWIALDLINEDMLAINYQDVEAKMKDADEAACELFQQMLVDNFVTMACDHFEMPEVDEAMLELAQSCKKLNENFEHFDINDAISEALDIIIIPYDIEEFVD